MTYTRLYSPSHRNRSPPSPPNEDRNVSIDILDKLKDGLNKEFDLKITSSDLLKYDESHITNYSRIDEKK